MSEMNCVLDRSDFKEQIVKTIPKVENTSEHKYVQQYKQSKQYNQQYDQDKPGDGNGYIVRSTYAKTRAKTWCLEGWCKKINSGAILDSIC